MDGKRLIRFRGENFVFKFVRINVDKPGLIDTVGQFSDSVTAMLFDLGLKTVSITSTSRAHPAG